MVVLCIAAGATGCGSSTVRPGPTSETSLPSAVGSSASASTSETAEKAKVESSYRAYYSALEQLMASGKADPAAMASVATPELALENAKAASGLFSSGQHMVGHVRITVRSVTIDGDRAHLRACIDGREWVSVPLASASPSPGQMGQAPGGAKTEAVRAGDGRWIFVSQVAANDASC
jgi:hypothetical protein